MHSNGHVAIGRGADSINVSFDEMDDSHITFDTDMDSLEDFIKNHIIQDIDLCKFISNI